MSSPRPGHTRNLKSSSAKRSTSARFLPAPLAFPARRQPDNPLPIRVCFCTDRPRREVIHLAAPPHSTAAGAGGAAERGVGLAGILHARGVLPREKGAHIACVCVPAKVFIGPSGSAGLCIPVGAGEVQPRFHPVPPPPHPTPSGF